MAISYQEKVRIAKEAQSYLEDSDLMRDMIKDTFSNMQEVTPAGAGFGPYGKVIFMSLWRIATVAAVHTLAHKEGIPLEDLVPTEEEKERFEQEFRATEGSFQKLVEEANDAYGDGMEAMLATLRDSDMPVGDLVKQALDGGMPEELGERFRQILTEHRNQPESD